MEELNISKDDYIYRQNSEGNNVYFILEGSISIIEEKTNTIFQTRNVTIITIFYYS